MKEADIFSEYGIRTRVVNDNGPQFSSEQLREFDSAV